MEAGRWGFQLRDSSPRRVDDRAHAGVRGPHDRAAMFDGPELRQRAKWSRGTRDVPNLDSLVRLTSRSASARASASPFRRRSRNDDGLPLGARVARPGACVSEPRRVKSTHEPTTSASGWRLVAPQSPCSWSAIRSAGSTSARMASFA